MAKRKPDRIDKAAAKMIDQMSGRSGLRAEPAAKRIAALVRREVRRAVKDERAHLRGEVVRIKANLSGGVPVLVDQRRQCLNTIERWLDAREGR